MNEGATVAQQSPESMIETNIPNPGLLRIDADGDVILVLKGRSKAPADSASETAALSTSETQGSFLVSGKVLTLASPVFRKMFGPNFAEGARKRKFSCPEIILHDDDPTAMRFMLQALHFQEPEGLDDMDPAKLSNVAIHCDKYDAVRPLQPMLSAKLNQIRARAFVKDYGHMLLSASLLRLPKFFSELSIVCQQTMTESGVLDWENTEVLNIIPATRGIMLPILPPYCLFNEY